MKIIMLKGNSNRGKATTLTLVYEQLLKSGGISTNKEQIGKKHVDFSDIVTIRGKRVAFYTMGDYVDGMVLCIKWYGSLGVDLLVCACNNKVFDVVWDAAEAYCPEIVKKTEVTSKTEVKKLRAYMKDIEKTLTLIQELIWKI